MELLLPPRLHPGDLIGVIAPSSPPVDQSRTDRGLAYLERKGFRVRPGAALRRTLGYLAGSDAERLADLHAMFADPEVRAILCVRGGSGASRLLPDLDFSLLRAHPKIFCGFSDVTALSMPMLAHAGLCSFAGPMVAVEMQQEEEDRETMDFFWSLLYGESRDLLCTSGEERRYFDRPGRARGPLLGGNLALLATLLGTPHAPAWEGSILFLEDVGENVYRLDRLLAHLRNAGVLGAVAGILLGSFTGIPDDDPNRRLSEVFEDYFAPLGVPVLSGIPFGHITPKITLPWGVEVEMDAEAGTVHLRGPVVR